ncbi:hypothetical protein B0J11DRAFT_91309 [Dendryphion nanum]|uniref:Uncharacterized protein n=1 Tax=Dendryphion nanum TaxID=256645 RepID=A0A9P9IFS5_9PLEO|nr:hypothetical protein B0J11DRAFT_91309 [Dendryphion nanum]
MTIMILGMNMVLGFGLAKETFGNGIGALGSSLRGCDVSRHNSGQIGRWPAHECRLRKRFPKEKSMIQRGIGRSTGIRVVTS